MKKFDPLTVMGVKKFRDETWVACFENAFIRADMWGNDASGITGGAGGVGGLLAIKDSANGVQFVAFDGNGNVASLSNEVDPNVRTTGRVF
jgi:hypothetical protein